MSPPFAVAAQSALVGEPARRWIAEQGWEADRAHPFQLSGERLGDQFFSVSRIWHTSGALHRTPKTAKCPDSLLILIGIDAGGSVDTGGRSWDFTERQIVITDAATPLRLVLPKDSARLEVVIQRHRLGAAQPLSGCSVEVVTADESYWRTLATLIVTILGTGISAHDSGFNPIKAAIEQVLIAAIVQSTCKRDFAGSSHAHLLTRARGIIEDRFDDVGFSTGELARALSVSPAHLHRIFAAASASPYQMIQKRRAIQAADLMRDAQISGSAVASRSGFSSPRAMRRAVLKHVDPKEENP